MKKRLLLFFCKDVVWVLLFFYLQSQMSGREAIRLFFNNILFTTLFYAFPVSLIGVLTFSLPCMIAMEAMAKRPVVLTVLVVLLILVSDILLLRYFLAADSKLILIRILLNLISLLLCMGRVNLKRNV